MVHVTRWAVGHEVACPSSYHKDYVRAWVYVQDPPDPVLAPTQVTTAVRTRQGSIMIWALPTGQKGSIFINIEKKKPWSPDISPGVGVNTATSA